MGEEVVSEIDERTITAIRTVVTEVLDSRSRIDPRVHSEDHEWVSEERRRLTRRAERREKIIQHVLGWGPS